MSTWTHTPLGSPRELADEDFELIVRRIAADVGFGSHVSLFVGQGLEYASSRPYQPGDPRRALDWRLTGRSGKPFVKQYEVLRRLPTYIVVDTSASMMVTSMPTRKFDLAVWIAAATGLICLRHMNPVSLLGHSDHPPQPGLRRPDLWLALDALRRRPSASSGLHVAVNRIEASAFSTSLVVVLSDFHDPDAARSLVRCALRHDCVAIRLFDPAEQGRLRAGFFRGRESESGAAFIGYGRTNWPAHTAAHDELLAAGIDVLTVRTDERPLAPIRRFLKSRGGFTRRCR